MSISAVKLSLILFIFRTSRERVPDLTVARVVAVPAARPTAALRAIVTPAS